MAVEQITPSTFTHLGDASCRADDVGEQNGCQYPVGAGPRTNAGDELLDLVEHRVGISDPVKVIGTGEFDVPRLWDVGGKVLAMCRSEHGVVAAVQNQRRHSDQRENRSEVCLL